MDWQKLILHKRNRKIGKLCLLISLCLLNAVGCKPQKEATAKEAYYAEAGSTKQPVEEENSLQKGESAPVEAEQTPLTLDKEAYPTEQPVETVVFPTANPEAVLQEDQLGAPRSSYGLGSAAFLKGRNVLVSVFVSEPGHPFQKEEKELALQKLSEATLYIEETAKDYGVETEFVYDWKQNPELCVETEIPFQLDESEESQDRLDEEFAGWTENKVQYEGILAKEKAEEIAACLFFNSRGRSYAIVYDGVDNVKESLVLFLYSKGESEGEETYVHEILHLFGAHDLYEGAEFTKEVTDYVRATYPDEIMLSVNNMGEGVHQQISRITAYHLGWLDELEELESFPQLQR